MADVQPKRLSFHEQQLQHAAGVEGIEQEVDALERLRLMHMELSKETRNHGLNRLQEARLSVDNGAGENDLKRLQRKFQATKATYINVDVKERFMSSLRAGTLDVATLEDAHHGLEEQLQRDSEALRGLKDQNASARGALQEASASIATLHQQFEQVMGDVAAQLDAIERSLQHFEATRPPPLEPLEDGPDQAACDQLLAREMARAKELEAAIAGSEAAIQEGEPGVRAGAHELAAVQEEVARMAAAQADRAKSTDCHAHLGRAAAWAGAAAAAVEALGGVAVKSIGSNQLVLELGTVVPTSLAAGAPLREERHELALALRPGGAAVAGVALSPPIVPIDGIAAAAAAAGSGGARAAVAEAQLCLLQHWSFQALLDAAAEKFTLRSVTGDAAGGPGDAERERLYEVPLASRPGVLLRVAVPAAWPRLVPSGSGGAEGPRLAGVAGAAPDAAALLAAAVSADGALRGADLRAFLEAVVAKAEALLPAAA